MTTTPVVRPCRTPRAWFASVIGLLGVASAPAVHAEPPQLSNEARADQLFRSGEKKFDSGDHAGACNDFSESLKLGPKLGTLLNLALCHETIGKPVTAWHEFSHAAAWAAQNSQRDRYEFATQHTRALEPKLPRVVLQLPTDRAIAGIDLDGEPVPEQRWYLPLYLDPGEHHLAVVAPGKQRTTVGFRVTASPSDQLVYIPRLADEKKTPPPKPPEPVVDPTRRMLGFVGLGLGAAGIVVGGTFGVLAITGDERDPAVHGQATAATVAFLAGAAFGAAGGWLLWTSTSPTGRSTALGAAPRHDGAGVSLTTTF
ncbi:MAG: hypothetical protein K0S65_570 [Labilithrix sp.]|jgi:hypothetical protein|nr:hypothetical protein [Labilithrix sp.]